MKAILLAAALILVSHTVIARDDPDLFSASRVPDIFAENDRLLRDYLEPGSVSLTEQEVDELLLIGSGGSLSLPSLDAFTGNEDTSLEFQRVELFAPQARIRVFGNGERFKAVPDSRHFYIASNATSGIGLAINLESGEVSGFASKYGEKLQISGDLFGQLEFSPLAEAGTGSSFCGTEMKEQPIDVLQRLENPAFASTSAAQSGVLISYEAVVAVDTDTEWLGGFGNDTDEALDWITDVFLAMNVFFERDVETRLLIGEVVLRTGSDPYTVSSDRFAQLNEFGLYWMENMDDVDRQFATMFSGRSIGSGSFSGIAWIDQYCEDGRPANGGTATVGSFSYNAIGSNRTAGNTAIYVGHELGHNMGSVHSHCYNPEVDRCYNAESGCYSGAPQCPAGGKGTVMSYCHVGGSSGAGCGTSKQEFHPTVQSLLENRLATELIAGCIAPHSGPEPEFVSTPTAGSTLDFGLNLLGQVSEPESIRVSNTGNANLTLACNLGGPNESSFNIVACPSPASPSSDVDITVSCEPLVSGSLSAQLTVSTNDSDEGSVDFSLLCRGIQVPNDDVIFSGSFEF